MSATTKLCYVEVFPIYSTITGEEDIICYTKESVKKRTIIGSHYS